MKKILIGNTKEKKTRINCDFLEVWLILGTPYGQLSMSKLDTQSALMWTREVRDDISSAGRSQGHMRPSTQDSAVSAGNALRQKSQH